MYTYSLVLLGNLNSKFRCMYVHQHSYKCIVLQYLHCHVFYNDGKCFYDTHVIKSFATHMSYKIYPYIKEETVPHLFATCTTYICLHALVDYVSKAATFVLSAHLCHIYLYILVNYVFKATTFTANQTTFRQTISTGFCVIILLQLWCKQFVVYQYMQAEIAGVVVVLYVE